MLNGGLAVELVLVGIGLALLAWRLVAAARVWRDARNHGLAPLPSLGWAASALVYPAWYWWGGRLPRLNRDEAQALLTKTAAAHQLATVTNLRCPLCDTELVNVLTLNVAGQALAVRARAVCPRCDFRVDACRHCRHFLPATEPIGGQPDMTHGRCKVYRAPQPVGETYPNVAGQLIRMGYDTLSSPKPILDSYQPLDECRSFALHLERLRLSRVAWLGRDRPALIRLAQRIKL